MGITDFHLQSTVTGALMDNGVCALSPAEVDNRHVFEHARTLLRPMGAAIARDQLTRRDIAASSLAQVTTHDNF